MHEQFYYQIGGFRGHITINWHGFKWSYESLADNLFLLFMEKKIGGTCELLLGIMPSGASYLLITSHQKKLLDEQIGSIQCKAPYPASRFASISPITFKTQHQLASILSRGYAQKSKKSKKGGSYDDDFDNSPANKMYCLDKNYENFSRPNFEHQRLFWRILESFKPDDDKCPNYLDLEKFNVSGRHQFQNVILRSFILHSWDKDFPLNNSTIRPPKILDIGWTDWSLHQESSSQHSSSSLSPSVSVDIVVERHMSLQYQNKARSAFLYGNTEKLNEVAIKTRLEKLFMSRTDGQHVVLLVYDEDHTRAYLNSLGIYDDVSDKHLWFSGIKNLLDSGVLISRGHGNSDNRHSYRRSSRSRSPKRRDSKSNFDKFSGKSSNIRDVDMSSARSKSSTLEPSKIYFVDIQSCYMALRQLPKKQQATFDKMVEDLGLGSSGWCAGNDSRTLFSAWKAMAEGTAIDFQRSEKWPTINSSDSGQESGTALESGSLGGDIESPDYDDERDPNDAPAVVQNQFTPSDPYERLELEDDDYSDDD